MNKQKISFRERLARFMYGRNGADQLYMFTSVVLLALIVTNFFARSIIITALEAAVIVYAMWRCFSKNVGKRRAENAKFCAILSRVKGFFSLQKRRWTDRKVNVYRTCPGCKKTVRLPKVKGTHTANCPSCHSRFNVRIL